MSGSSLEARGVKGQADHEGWPLLPGPSTTLGAVHMLSHVILKGKAAEPCAVLTHFRDEKADPQVKQHDPATPAARRQNRTQQPDSKAHSRLPVQTPKGGREGKRQRRGSERVWMGMEGD